eukprot:CAMPEP_0197649724 /NCGR_PEP_ID=MMETSP1338-20131121/29437_1 /TAXON_ID=43686 ORGANISM="Pelagodinium beii, Strain RCC1491" /NCGR_SAMPLE_ID=MMETSP1338 /ASSEMBLY_ACC=CAM_ASM_000754 /LENGTH=144 /DNA_ID=CAMNT_0043223971 /DNA_START=46 /DNA_END=480 /DNA_ORIENTATION=+
MTASMKAILLLAFLSFADAAKTLNHDTLASSDNIDLKVFGDKYEEEAEQEEKAEAEADPSDADASPCDEYCRFDILMCKSFMCTTCTYEWCTAACQNIQSDFPNVRCKEWPEARTSYSNGDFATKGKLGDGGDFAAKTEAQKAE